MKFDFVWRAKSLTFPTKYGKLNKSPAREGRITEERVEKLFEKDSKRG